MSECSILEFSVLVSKQMAEAATARYILYVKTREEGVMLLKQASPEAKRQTWIQEISKVPAAPWMKSVSFPCLVDRRVAKAYSGGAEIEILVGKEAKAAQPFGAVDDLD